MMEVVGSGGAGSGTGAAAPVKDDVELYVRTYTTILRSSGEVRLRAFEAAHKRVGSSLHAVADGETPDAGALIYAIQRVPAALAEVTGCIWGRRGSTSGRCWGRR